MEKNTQFEIQLLSAKQLGQRLSLSKRQIFRLNSCGKIPTPLKIGGAVRWNQTDIDLWISLGCPSRAELEVRRKVGAGL